MTLTICAYCGNAHGMRLDTVCPFRTKQQMQELDAERGLLNNINVQLAIEKIQDKPTLKPKKK